MNMPVKDVLRSKGTAVHTIAPSAPVLEAVRQMRAHRVGCLVVLSKAGRVSGLVAERDCLWRTLAEKRSPRTMLVRQIMTPLRALRAVTPDQTVADCMTLMTESRQRHVPVLQGTKLAGLISIGDVVKFLLGDQQATIQSLEKYIEGSL